MNMIFINEKKLNPKAREALAKSSIDVGVAIFKSVMLVICVLPITLIVKDVIEGDKSAFKLNDILTFIASPKYFILAGLLLLSMLLGLYLRGAGLKILHDMEEPNKFKNLRLRLGRGKPRPF